MACRIAPWAIVKKNIKKNYKSFGKKKITYSFPSPLFGVVSFTAFGGLPPTHPAHDVQDLLCQRGLARENLSERGLRSAFRYQLECDGFH